MRQGGEGCEGPPDEGHEKQQMLDRLLLRAYRVTEGPRMTLPPSRLFDYANRQQLDAIGVNAFASDGRESPPRIPAELLYRPFQLFLDGVREPLRTHSDPRMDIPGNTPPPDFFSSVHRLLKCVARRYENENLYSSALNEVMSALIGINISRALTPRSAGEREGQTDGTIIYAPFASTRRQFILIREDKLGSGTGGGDSFVELVGHYANIVANGPPAPPNPCVFLEVVGPRLTVSLAACSEVGDISVTPAVVTLNLQVQACPDELYGRIAALFVGLRQLTTVVAAECLSFPPLLLTQGSRRGPNLVFQSEAGFSKFLRCSSTYGAEAHAWCASHHFAPPFQERSVCAGWREIIMHTAMADKWLMAMEAPTDRRVDILKAVRNVLTRMHENGFVHGDIRAANVMVCFPKNELTVMLIDFDEAGRVNQAHYSLLPFNPAVPCAPGVVPGGRIEVAHDLWRVESQESFFV